MTIFQTFFDETGGSSDDRILRWVGLLSWHGFWSEQFHPSWCRILREKPAIRYWHTVSAHHGRLDIAEDKRRDKEVALCKLIGENAASIAGLVVELSLDDVREHVYGKTVETEVQQSIAPGLRPFLENPKCIAMRYAIAESVKLAAHLNNQLTPGDPLKVWTVFEDDESMTEFQDEMCFTMQVLRKGLSQQSRRKVGPVIFVEGKGPLGQTPLQAADLYAWHVQRMVRTGKEQPGWEFLKALSCRRVVIGASELRSLVEELNRGVRVEI